jgi:hypothetical protein
MTQWFTEQGPAILAILGAAYALARGVVALTPTPSDDAWLSTAQRFVMSLARLFGLDSNQGRKTP